MLLVHFVLVARALRAPVAIVTALLGYALVMDSSWWQDHIAMVQLSEPIAFAYVVTWLLLRRRHDVAAGIALGVAIALKPYAALMLVPLVVWRRWPAACAAVAIYLAAAATVTWRFGARAWSEYAAMVPAAQAGWTAHIRNASLHGIVARLWRPACGAGGTPPRVALALAALAALALVALLAWHARLRPAPGDGAVDADIDLPFAAFTVASAWLNPVTWEHYDVTLVLPMAVALAYAWRATPRPWAIATTVVLAVVALLLAINMRAKLHVATDWPHHRHLMLHFFEVANWLPWPLVLATCVALERHRRSARVRP